MTFQQTVPSYSTLILTLVVLSGFVVALAVHVYAVVIGLVRRPKDITPKQYRFEKTVDGRLRRHDPGWPIYVHRQWAADLHNQYAVAWGTYVQLWVRARKRFNNGAWILIFPVPVLTFASLCAVWPFMVALTIVFLSAFVAVYIVAAPLHWLLVLLMRIADDVWRASHGGTASCPDCYALMPRPAYQHAGCSMVHRDMRPSAEGAIVRVCSCGTGLPATGTAASWLLNPLCQHCGAPLHKGAGAIRDVRISVVGEVGSGKSMFTYASLTKLEAWSRSLGTAFSYADQHSKSAANVARISLKESGTIAKTGPALPRALTVQVGGVVSGALVHLFDSAGTRFHDVEAHDDMKYLGDSHGIVFMVDPFSLESVRAELKRQNRSELLREHPLKSRPEDLYGAVVSRMRAAGHRVRGQRLAVVIGKADLLAQAGIQLPTDSAQISAWLHDRGQHNMVVAAKREFAAVRYFAADLRARDRAATQFDPSAPIRWLMNSRRFVGEQARRTRPSVQQESQAEEVAA